MKKIYAGIFLFLIFIQNIWAIEIESVEYSFVKRIETNIIGVDISPYGMASVGKMSSDNVGRIYINNYPHFKINIHNSDMTIFRYINLPKNKIDLLQMRKFEPDSESNIISLQENMSFIKYDQTGEEIFRIGSNNILNSGIDFWLYKNFILFYDKDNNQKIIDKNGKTLSKLERMKIIEQLQKKSSLLMNKPDGERIKLFLMENNIFIINNIILFNNSEQLMKYILFLNPDILNMRIGKNSFSDVKIADYGFLFDNNGNIHCLLLDKKNGDTISPVIFSNLGELIFAFRAINNFETNYDIYMSFVNKANGDIYAFGLDRDEPAYYFYKIENTWDLELKSIWQEKQVSTNFFKLKNLTTTSLLTESKDKNAYHPVKLFDNNPKTMWIENAKGPGIGEKISFSFDKDITIDKITFQPGCFWDKYWKQNNRVKKMRMKLDGKNYTIDFDDEMKDQGITFNEPVSFSDVELIIEAVYKTTKWDDTAVSGIKFYLNDEEIKIDTSKFAEGFEVKK